MSQKGTLNQIEPLKRSLRKTIDGKFMIRQDRGYKGLEQAGVYAYRVYYDTPTSENRDAILKAIEEHGFKTYQKRPSVIGGSYGYTLIFQTTP